MIEVMLILVIVFIALLVMDVPIAVAIGLASVIGIETNGRLPLLLVAQRMFMRLQGLKSNVHHIV